jgi:phosphate transport system permease protein
LVLAGQWVKLSGNKIIGNVIGMLAIPTTLFSQSQTLSSLIANEFNEASSDLHLQP